MMLLMILLLLLLLLLLRAEGAYDVNDGGAMFSKKDSAFRGPNPVESS